MARRHLAHSRSPISTVIIALATAVAVVALAGCGATQISANTGGPTPIDRVGDSVLSPEAIEAMASARFEGQVTLSAPADAGSDLAVAFSGAYDREQRSGSLTAEIDPDGSGAAALLGGFGPVEIRVVDGEAFARGGPLALIGAGRSWVDLSTMHHDAASGELGRGFGADDIDRLEPLLEPDQLIEALADTPATVEELGRESLRGVDTRHVRLTMSPSDLHDALDDTLDDDRAEHDLDAVATTPVDLWLDDAGVVHRISATVIAPAAVAGMSAAGSSIDVTVDLFDHGRAPDIEAPPEADTITGSDLGLDG